MALDSTLDFALCYAAAGFKVIPVTGKIPLVEHGAHDSSADEATIRGWWQRWPAANIGLVLDGLVAVDVDPRNGGAVDALRHPLPDTCYAKTGGGGFHYLFRSRNGTRYPGKLALGIDLKHGAGSYICVEPSIHASGQKYVWLDESEPWTTTPADAPEWLALDPGQPAANSEQPAGAIPAGWRNAHLTSLAGSMRRRNMSVEAILSALLVENSKRCSPPLDDLDVRRIAKSVARYAPAEDPKAEAPKDKPEPEDWPPGLDLVALSEREPLPPSFIVKDLLPAGYATLFAGHGGVGKSGIALYLACCITLGRPFFGIPVEQRRVLYLSCEDRERILHWRLKRICTHLNVSMAELHGLEIIDLVTSSTILWARDPRTGAALTGAYGKLDRRIQKFQSEVLMVDGINDTYGGRGGDSVEIKDFVKALVRLVPDDEGAVLLVGHISKPAAMGIGGPTTEGYGGATGWHNSVRSRLYLYPETEQDEEAARAERTGALLLEHQKANYGSLADTMRFEWSDDSDMFLGKAVAEESLFDRKHRDRMECEAILEAIKWCEKVGIVVPASNGGQRPCYQVLSIRPEFPATLKTGKQSKKRFRAHIELLHQSGCIALGAITTASRHKIATFASTGKACAESRNVD